jgi:hypothetical protein
MSDRRGIRVSCTVCHLTKKPFGRSAPLPMANSLCVCDCPGYNKDPQVGSLWPGELASEFSYPVSDFATEEVEE